jgi:tetratricopeptide (TPR) repeat protein
MATAVGLDHPYVNQALLLAALYSDQGRYDEAVKLLERGLAITEKASGPDNPDIANVLTALATAYRAQGRYDEAEPLLKRSLAITEKAGAQD